MRTLLTSFLLSFVTLCLMPSTAMAIQVCDIDGQSVNPNNGHTTAGKTGLMRCRDGEGGPLLREQELKNGVFIGIVRYYKDGQLQREHSVNERGNRDGRIREYDGKQLVYEATERNGRTFGLARRWHPNGKLKEVRFLDDDGKTLAEAEFTSQGQLRGLRCGEKPMLAPDADDADWCGHRSGTGTVTLYAENGSKRGTVVHERGERRKSESLWDNGKVRDQTESRVDGGVERSFSDTGVKRRERLWVTTPVEGKPPRRTTTVEREFHESGPITLERQWKPTERGADLLTEQRWYLNGQVKEKVEYVQVEGQPARRDTDFHDNGRIASEGVYLLTSRYGRNPIGVHKSYDTDGRLHFERHHDAKGRVARERELDASGQTVRDDELFEDGSRKAFKTGR